MKLAKRIVELFRRNRLDRELDDEMSFHLSLMEEEFRGKGMSAEEARAAARRDFGGVAHAQEAYRAERGMPRLENLAKDARYALLGFRRNPGFAAAAVISLALGIGANTTVFSLFRAVMLRSLPVSHPEQLVVLYRTAGWGFHGEAPYPLCLDLRAHSELFQGVLATSGPGKVRFTAAAGQHMEFANLAFVSGDYFSLLGVNAAMGRLFTPDDNRVPHAHPLVVVSYDFWRNRLGSDPQVLGRTLLVDEDPLTVIGVAPPGFRGVQIETHTDLWAPLMMSHDNVMNAGMNWLSLIARVRPGISRRRVQSSVDAIMQQFLQTQYGSSPNAAFRKFSLQQRLEVRDAGVGLSELRELFGKPLTILMAAVGLVLLAACANVANLLLARGAARSREIAMRFSLGATRARLVSQALTECFLLAAAGCLLGVELAIWGVHQLVRLLPGAAAQGLDAAPDFTVLAFTAAISVLAVLLFGLAPALRSTAVDPASALKSGSSSIAGGRQPFRRTLVVAQVAFSVVLAVLAGLFGRSLAELRGVDLGFRGRSVVAFSLDVPSSWKPADRTAARTRMISQIESLPGVRSVSYGFPGPFQMGMSKWTVRVPDSRTVTEPAAVAVHTVAPRYLETLESMPVLGRDLAQTDTADAPKVAVVNEAFVHKFLPGETSPLGHSLSFEGDHTAIVGVVRDIPHQGLRENVEPTVYVPAAQKPSLGGNPTILVRSQLSAASLLPAIRRELANLNPQIVVDHPKTLAAAVEESIFQDRILALLGACFGALALLLAAIGLYGVMAYSTAQRSGEFGMRLALGAQRSDVLWIVLRDALLLVGCGIMLGLPVSLFASKYVSSILFGVSAGDAVSFAGASATLLLTGLAASFVPARRSAGMDPLRALRHE